MSDSAGANEAPKVSYIGYKTSGTERREAVLNEMRLLMCDAIECSPRYLDETIKMLREAPGDWVFCADHKRDRVVLALAWVGIGVMERK